VRPEVAAQVPSYLTLPTALFSASYQDLDSLHRRLGEIRDAPPETGALDGEVFVRSYGAAFRYDSNRSFVDYGFNSTQDYGAIQAGFNAIAYRNASGELRVGLAGIYGQLWFEPSAIDGSSSGAFNTETLVGALTWQSRAGWYVDGLVSAGAFSGAVSTAVRGHTGNADGNSWAASIEIGYPIGLGWAGLALEPQVQLVYQNLNFRSFTDADGIVANLGNQSEGVFRGGARLLKAFALQDGAAFTAYLKANVLTGLGGGGGGAIALDGTPFATGTFGTSVQVGGGVNGTIAHNVTAYGDVAWQSGVAASGSRGWLFNGGVRYAF
jgi:outer membrane autotransporter protein